MTSLVQLVSSLLRNKRGNVAMIVALLFVPMVLAGGAGVDLARYEAVRVEMQDGLDRGVLAAASLSQKQKTADVLKSYMNNLPYGADVAIDFSEATAMNSRKISANASYTINTAFMHLAGVKTLTIKTASSAEEAKQNIELSLMLDMSGSMVGSKIKNLKVASQQFIDQILTDDTKDYTTISVVPYAGHVNVGSAVFDKLGGSRLTGSRSRPRIQITRGHASSSTMRALAATRSRASRLGRTCRSSPTGTTTRQTRKRNGGGVPAKRTQSPTSPMTRPISKPG
ncbi:MULTISPECIES: pilus assembly protein TadG-related protein [unclassified Rhizobium]|uniref:pilus assembly protein TadG-related protein n=1 Tax=unclassified Rhizobium TaxID=2613769 RepID=UPI0025D85E14|nr:pilus assembly protein TadG-related protein [Rhizobium sp. UBA1881]